MSAQAIFCKDPAAYLNAVWEAFKNGTPTFLGNPHWSLAAQTEAAQLIPVHTKIVGEGLTPMGPTPANWPHAWQGQLFIPTGGTGGKVKFVAHNATSLRAAAISLQQYLVARGFSSVLHGVSLTPPWHISGLMPAFRAHFTGGTHRIFPSLLTAEHALPDLNLPSDGCRLLSVVPTQLQALLQHPHGKKWLGAFSAILVGGSALPPGFVKLIGDCPVPIYLTYGMTETAAAIALCPPEKITEANPIAGEALPNVQWSLEGDRICLSTPALASHYWPHEKINQPFVTGDRGKILGDGRLVVLGRADRIIISGGEKIDPAIIEQVLLQTGLVQGVHIWGEPHPRWGQQVTAFVVGSAAHETSLRAALNTLAPAHRPKEFIFGATLPLDNRGKFDVPQALALRKN